MNAGRRCYQGTTLHELRREHVATVAKPLNEVVPDVPRGFSEAIQRATAKDRADRQSTAQELSRELKNGLASDVASPPSSNFAETISTGATLTTNSDVNAPTVVGVDAASTAAPSSTPPVITNPPPVQAPPDASMSAATVVESAAMASSVTVQQKPKVAEVTVQPSQSKSKVGLVVGLFAFVLVIAVLGVGGFFVYRQMKPTPVSPKANNNSTVTVATPVDAGRYWLMLEPKSREEAPTRVAGLVPLTSGQAFQMRFVFPANGYVYIVGPGENNKPTAFLTTKPSPQTGLKTNDVKAGAEFSFPSGDGLLNLDSKPGTDKFTVIFSKSRLESPGFLNEPVAGTPMNAGQLAEFNSFVSKNLQKPPSTELDDSNNQLPFVRVKVDAERADSPLVFEIRIQHN